MRIHKITYDGVRRALFLALALLLAMGLWLPIRVYGAEAGETYIYDEALLFDEQQWSDLQERAAAISAEYLCGVYFVAVEDFEEYSNTGDVRTAAEDLYLYNEWGWGEEKDGILLLLSMDQRDYALIAYGDFGNAAFTDYGKDVMSENFLDDFAEDDWYGGCEDYLSDCGSLLKQARSGQPFDVPQEEGSSAVSRDASEVGITVLMALIPSAAFAMVVCVVMKRQMKTARKQTDAFDYVVDGAAEFRIRDDRFSHVTTTRRRISSGNNNHKSGGHGGGTHVNSRGFSGKSGKF
ncbi:MAG: TPM domain-containing protein [Firmicutes bacterium]|nr:TPM domain-containing protein [Bacillota bacterium]